MFHVINSLIFGFMFYDEDPTLNKFFGIKEDPNMQLAIYDYKKQMKYLICFQSLHSLPKVKGEQQSQEGKAEGRPAA